jgi:hypothetical protein
MKPMPRGGRTKGARNRLSAQVIDDILADWREHGAAAIKIMRVEDPGAYVRVVVSTLPKEFTVESVLGDVDDDQLDDLIEQLKQLALARQPMLIEGEKCPSISTPFLLKKSMG